MCEELLAFPAGGNPPRAQSHFFKSIQHLPMFLSWCPHARQASPSALVLFSNPTSCQNVRADSTFPLCSFDLRRPAVATVFAHSSQCFNYVDCVTTLQWST